MKIFKGKGQRAKGKASAARIGRAERAQQALELRKAGWCFREIGRKMGFSEQRAHAMVTAELARLNVKRSEAAGGEKSFYTAAYVARIEVKTGSDESRHVRIAQAHERRSARLLLDYLFPIGEDVRSIPPPFNSGIEDEVQQDSDQAPPGQEVVAVFAVCPSCGVHIPAEFVAAGRPRPFLSFSSSN